jgi:hypothetical protein
MNWEINYNNWSERHSFVVRCWCLCCLLWKKNIVLSLKSTTKVVLKNRALERLANFCLLLALPKASQVIWILARQRRGVPEKCSLRQRERVLRQLCLHTKELQHEVGLLLINAIYSRGDSGRGEDNIVCKWTADVRSVLADCQIGVWSTISYSLFLRLFFKRLITWWHRYKGTTSYAQHCSTNSAACDLFCTVVPFLKLQAFW